MTAKTIMIQGTGSHVGKSYLTAGLCRLFRGEGRTVAPFKSQNMALNSYATDEGFEIGRAQAVQAMAAGIRATVDMNPILLKPDSDRRSQVIVNGRSVGSMDAGVYYSKKAEWLPVWKSALQRLKAEYELIVIEGAGSPAEINLIDRDIANMAVAREAAAPVLLVTDIDRGGAFASLFGTFSLLPAEDRRRIAGFIINKFRGDPGILAGGLSMLAEKTGVPVLGVVPFVDIELEEEDSVSLEANAGKLSEDRGPDESLRIAVPLLPRISNFTDLHPFKLLKGVRLHYVKSLSELGRPHAVILPGSKNTISDLRWLKERGLAAAFIELAESGIPILGICGGYQMLGATISDPLGLEGAAGDLETGLNLLPIHSELRADKHVKQVDTIIVGGAEVFGPDAIGAAIEGYEIHVGVSTANGPGSPCMMGADGGTGWTSNELAVAGTYAHGLFDNQKLLSSFLDLLARQAGVAPIDTRSADFATRIDSLADTLRESLDIDRIRQLIDMGITEKAGIGTR